MIFIQNILLFRTCIQCITGVRIIEQRRNNQTEGYDQYDAFQFKGNYFTTLHLVTGMKSTRITVKSKLIYKEFSMVIGIPNSSQWPM